MRYTEQLERESEQCRAALQESLGELRARMTPGHLLDEVLGYTRDSSGAAFLDNLKQRAVRNPLPLTLVGTGLAWLMMGDDGSAPRAEVTAAPSPDHRREVSGSGSGGIGDTAGDLGRRVGATASAIGEGVTSAYENLADGASRGSAAVGHIGDRAASAAQGFGQLWRDQPLIVAGLGIAVGAALGAWLPATEFENRTLGSSKDKLKDEAEDFALRQLDKADKVAEHVVNEVRDAAEREGLTGEAIVGETVESLERGDIIPPSSALPEAGPDGRARTNPRNDP